MGSFVCILLLVLAAVKYMVDDRNANIFAVAVLWFAFASSIGKAREGDSKLLLSSDKGLIPPSNTRQLIVEAVLKARPAAVKIFESHNEFMTLVLFKFSDGTFGEIEWGVRTRSRIVLNADSRKNVNVKALEPITGEVELEVPEIPVTGKSYALSSAWGIHEEALDLQGASKLIFLYEFDGGPKLKPNGVNLTIALNWSAGTVEAIRTSPKTNNREP